MWEGRSGRTIMAFRSDGHSKNVTRRALPVTTVTGPLISFSLWRVYRLTSDCGPNATPPTARASSTSTKRGAAAQETSVESRLAAALTLMSDDLPHPFGPTTATTMGGGTSASFFLISTWSLRCPRSRLR